MPANDVSSPATCGIGALIVTGIASSMSDHQECCDKVIGDSESRIFVCGSQLLLVDLD